MTEETVGWIGAPDDPAPVPGAVEPVAAGGRVERQDRLTAVGKIAIALLVAWSALVAVPGALPWETTDDSVRAIAFAIVIASVVALVGAVLAWIATDELAESGATVGMAAGLAALGLAALEVVNVMVLPQDAPYRLLAT